MRCFERILGIAKVSIVPPGSLTLFQDLCLTMFAIAIVVSLLVVSNLFMTYAWYGHLKDLADKPWYIAVLVSWGIAFFEYLLQVPANRYGNAQNLQLGQLKILQEVITLSVFVPFSLLYMQRPLSLNFLWAGLCMCGAVYFVFRS